MIIEGYHLKRNGKCHACSELLEKGCFVIRFGEWWTRKGSTHICVHCADKIGDIRKMENPVVQIPV